LGDKLEEAERREKELKHHLQQKDDLIELMRIKEGELGKQIQTL
jgi:hypothetical protein